MTSQKALITLFVGAALIAAPWFLYPVFLMKVLCFGLFACAFNLLLGYVGLLSFGHAAYFGGAAYISAHLVKVGTVSLPYWAGSWQWANFSFGPVTPEIGILAGVLFATLLGLLFGSLAIRRQGIYFSMITLALAQMFDLFCVQAPFTGNEDGIQAVPRTAMFGFIDISTETRLYYVVLAIFLIGFGIIYRTIHSPFGQVLKAIRENEPRAISLGYNVDRFKLIAFVLSCAMAGLAGATKAIVFRLASLTDVGFQMSGEVVLMTLVGGIGTILGPVAGATIVVGMQNYLATLGEWVLVIQGLIFVLCVLLFRRGVVGEVLAWWRRRHAPAEADTAAKPVTAH